MRLSYQDTNKKTVGASEKSTASTAFFKLLTTFLKKCIFVLELLKKLVYNVCEYNSERAKLCLTFYSKEIQAANLSQH